MHIGDLFLSFIIAFYYFDLLVKAFAVLMDINSSQDIVFFDFLLYFAFTIVYIPISKKYIGLYKSILFIIFPTFLSLAILYASSDYERNKFIVTILLIILLIGMVTLIYAMIRIPIWVMRQINK